MSTDDIADFGCTKNELIEAVHAGANRDDVARIEGAVWRLFDRVSGLRYFMDASTAYLDARPPEICIGQLVIRHAGDRIWIGRTDGEGGEFVADDVERALLDFYMANF
jgi:hypothetical protein